MSESHTISVDVVKDAAPNALVYRIHGIFGETSSSYRFLDHLREEMRSKEFADRERVVFNLEDVEFLSSVGVGILASCYTTAKKANKSFVLAGVSEQASRVLDITGMSGLVPRYASEEDALDPKAEPIETE